MHMKQVKTTRTALTCWVRLAGHSELESSVSQGARGALKHGVSAMIALVAVMFSKLGAIHVYCGAN